MSTREKTNYSLEFRQSSVKLALESEHPISQTARDLGIKVNTLYSWVRNHSKNLGTVSNNSECHFTEVARLKKELSRVTQERDLLKKAAAYFAKISQ
jgi:transposase